MIYIETRSQLSQAIMQERDTASMSVKSFRLVFKYHEAKNTELVCGFRRLLRIRIAVRFLYSLNVVDSHSRIKHSIAASSTETKGFRP